MTVGKTWFRPALIVPTVALFLRTHRLNADSSMNFESFVVRPHRRLVEKYAKP
jgi:hypothetical protein